MSAGESVLNDELEPTEPFASGAVPVVDVTAHDDYDEKDPGKVLGIVGIVLSLALGLIGVALGIVSYKKSRAVGFAGTLGTVSIIVGVITTVLLVLQLVLLSTNNGIGGACDGRKAGVYTLDNGTRISCQ
ncbi:hypothetical protein [Homoserinimonas hongtaonis]|uniref:DUF4190 domain-containing protein n=1 Tax=Homoserinimonas hongtaonis TaxID=2079791 RepID=A0A2U1T235_9MICO|nr:hypothetical protein [Salinibacterium hongtaonis]PWB97927.1 hypothetical protein DF220_08865 [Salinibacterium hongtaonis]